MIRILNVYYPTRTVMLLLCELMLVAGCFLLSACLLLRADTYIALFYEHGLEKIAALALFTTFLSYQFDLYEPQILSGNLDVYFRILIVLGADCFILSTAIYISPDAAVGRSVYPLGVLLLTPALIFWRQLYDWITARRLFCENVFILGSGAAAHSLAETIEVRSELGMKVINELPSGLAKVERRRYWAEELKSLASAAPQAHRVIIAVEDAREELPVEELVSLRFRGIVVEASSRLHERLSGKVILDGLRPSTFLFDEGLRLTTLQASMRHALSVTTAAVGLILFLPFFPIVALAIKLSSKGPLFFSQVRVGKGGREFKVWKFRTMRTDAEQAGAQWAKKNDPRITGIGRFLRKTRIDEIPQLWNVLCGDMALVGPRPERPEFVTWLSHELPFYYLRSAVRPGLTGWAQVRYGYGATLEETRVKLEYDLFYVKYMSLGLDLLIMFETIKTIIRRRGL